MVGNSIIHVSTVLPSSSYLITPTTRNGHFTSITPPPPRHNKVNDSLIVKAATCTPDAGHSQQQPPSSSSESINPLALVFRVPPTIWRHTLRPLNDFGFGRSSIWEGGVGLFVVSGTVLLALSLAWLRSFQLRSKFRKYLAVFEFEQACGICTGTPVRIRGVNVGSVIRVNPSLKSIQAVVEVEDDKIIIPTTSLVEVNQSGLLMETMIDITPRNPIPAPSLGPLDPDCGKEGLIVCDRQKLKGYQGVSLDALVGILTRLGREVEEIGVANTYALAERVSAVIIEAWPLLAKLYLESWWFHAFIFSSQEKISALI